MNITPQPDWAPERTAPKDGSDVLVIDEDGDMYFAYWMADPSATRLEERIPSWRSGKFFGCAVVGWLDLQAPSPKALRALKRANEEAA